MENRKIDVLGSHPNNNSENRDWGGREGNKGRIGSPTFPRIEEQVYTIMEPLSTQHNK